MYSSYNPKLTRSRSTTDINHQDNNDKEYELTSSYSTLSRKFRRKQQQQATSSPKKNGISNNKDNGDDHKCTYLTDTIRRQYEFGYEAAAPVAQQQSSFVRRLVATLERRNRDSGGGGHNNSNRMTPLRSGSMRFGSKKEDRGTASPGKKKVVSPKRRSQPGPPKGLDDLWDMKNFESTSNDDEDEFENIYDDYWRECTDQVPPLPSKSNNHHHHHQQASIKVSAKRALRKFTSFLGFRGANNSTNNSAKNLPKGSREFYATRESLSDELGAFRRETVPQLIKKTDLTYGHLMRDNDEQSNFSRLIGNPKTSTMMMMVPDYEEVPPSTATIHRTYNNRGGGLQPPRPFDQPSVYQIPRCRLQTSRSYDNDKESIYKSPREIKLPPKKIEAPPPPLPPPMSRPPSPPMRTTLLRSSAIHEEEKRLSQDSGIAIVQLRRKPDANKTDNSVIYDVPRLKPRPVSSVSTIGSSTVPTIYENAEVFFKRDDEDDDKRLNITQFMSF